MGGLTRAEAEERIEQDNGDGDDEVWVSKLHAKTRPAYHNNRDCQSLQKVSECRSLTRKQAQLRWLSPCLWCVLESGGDG